VKVIRIPETSPDTYKALLDFGKALEKTTVEAKVWTPLAVVKS